MVIIRFLLFLVLLFIISPVCLDPNENSGQCSGCAPKEVLVEGDCYQKIRGCLLHRIGPICEKCVNGYVLHEGSCIRQAIFNKLLESEEIPPVDVHEPLQLTFEEIVDKLASKHGSTASAVHSYLEQIHPEEIKGAFPTKVNQIESKRHTLINMVYQKYISLALKSHLSQITEIYFDSSIIEYPDIILEINNILESQLNALDQQMYLYDIQYAEELFTFVYFSKKGEKVLIVKVQYLNHNLISKQSTQERTKQDIAFEEAVKQFSYLGIYEVTKKVAKVIENEEIFIFQLADKIQVSVQLKNNEFLVNQPFRINRPFPTTDPLLGGFSEFTEFEDERFLKSIEFVKSQFGELSDYHVTYSYFQIVAGINFLIYFSNDIDEIIIKVYYSLQGQMKLLNAEKNGENIFTFYLEYNSDPFFLESYQYFKGRAKIVVFPPIRSVFRRVERNIYYYKVTYSSDMFSQFSYDKETEQIILISYTIGEQNILELRKQLLRIERSPKVLMHFLQEIQPVLIQNYRVRSVVHEKYTYTIKFVVEDGTYIGKIKDQGVMVFLSLNKESEDNCFEIGAEQIQKDFILSEVDTFLRGEFNLNPFNLHLFQMKIEENINKIRLVYSTGALKQAEFYLEEKEQSINVIYGFVLNYGYEVFIEDQNDAEYQKVKEIAFSTIGSHLDPFLTEKNGTHYKLFCKTSDKTVQMTVNPKKQEGDLKYIHARTKSLYPANFDPKKFLYQEDWANNDAFQTVKASLEKQFSSYLKEIQIWFVETQNNLYKLMFSSENIYFSVQSELKGETEVDFGPLIVTTYKPGDFTNCKRYNEDVTKCLSCSESQIEYQGHCHQPLEGCLIQPGQLCLKCDSHYVFSNYKCIKECSAFFL